MKILIKSLALLVLASMLFVSCSKAPVPTFTKAETTKKTVVDSNSTAITADKNVSTLGDLGDLDDLALLVDGNESVGITKGNTSTRETAKISENNVSTGETAGKKVIKTVFKKEVLKFTPKKVVFKKTFVAYEEKAKVVPKKKKVVKTTSFENVKVNINKAQVEAKKFTIENANISVKNLKIVTPDNMGSQQIDFKTKDEKKEENLVEAFSVNIPGKEDKNVSITYNHSYDINDSGVYGCTTIIFGKNLADENIEVSGVVKSANVRVLAEAGKFCINDENAKAGSKYYFDVVIEVLNNPKISVSMEFKIAYVVPENGARHLLIGKESFLEKETFIEKETPLDTKNLKTNPILEINPPLK